MAEMKLNVPNALTSAYVFLSLVAWIAGGQFLTLSGNHFLPGLLTYPFLSLSSLFSLALSAFFLWMTLSTLLMRLSEKMLALLFFSATLFIGGSTLGLIWLTKSPFILAGPSPILYCLLVFLLLNDRNIRILLLGLLPIQPKVLVIIGLGLNTIHLLSEAAYIQIAANLSGVLFAFAFAPFMKKPVYRVR